MTTNAFDKKNTTIDHLWKTYDTVKDYDIHYSTMRTLISLALLTASLTIGGLFIDKNDFFMALIMPSLFLIIAIFLNNFFIFVMTSCLEHASQIEEAIANITLYKYEENFEHIKELINFRKKIGEKILVKFRFWRFSKQTINEPGITALFSIIIVNALVVLISYMFK